MAESTGPATDKGNEPVVDPTANVFQLVEAAIQRQDDLREAEQTHMREVLELRTELGTQGSNCASEIAELRATYAMKIDSIREQHAESLRQAEAQRIDAIRSVDVEAVQRAAEVQATQANALANQVTASAEAMRTQVAAAATAATTGLSAALEPIQKDIQDLRKAQYEAQGVKAQSTDTRGGVAVTIAGVSAFVAVIAVVVALLTALPH